MRNLNLSMIVLFLTLGVASGCNSDLDLDDTVASREAASTLGNPARQPSFNIELTKGDTLVYREASAFGILQMESGSAYALDVHSSVPGTIFRISLDGAAASPLESGRNLIPSAAFPMPSIGNHSLRVDAELDGVVVSRNYALGISCEAAIANSIVLNPTAIAVSAIYPNVYQYTAGVIATGGIGPFDCSWDFNGDGVRDSGFASCATPVRAYSNHVDSRKIKTFVRDTVCNKILVVDVDRELTAPPYAAVLGMKSNLYVTGTVSSSAPALTQNPAVSLRHLSSNQPDILPARVTCNYSRVNGKGTFTVKGLNTYALTSSKSHGFSITVSNIDDTIIGGVGGSMNAANAVLQQVQFSTDESPDLLNRMVFQGGQTFCQLNSVNMEPKDIGGVPCMNPGTPIQSSYIVAGEGTFQCTGLPGTSALGTSINVTQGAFYCEYRFVDACGGGGGGGGVDPIKL